MYSHLTLAEIEQRYVRDGLPMPRELAAALESDPRAGAARILQAVERRRQRNRIEGQRLRQLSRFERELWDAGHMHVAGVDEAGMSPLAGPVVAGAAILPRGYRLAGLDDSKKLSAARREQLAAELRREAVAWGIGRVEPAEIDAINIYRAGLLAMRRAVEALGVVPSHLLIDARPLKELDIPQQSIIKGDAKSISIAAASILAKTRRDAIMVEYDQTYPGYGFAQHKGYPVAAHVRAIEKLGVSPIHRKSFGPVRRLLTPAPHQTELF